MPRITRLLRLLVPVAAVAAVAVAAVGQDGGERLRSVPAMSLSAGEGVPEAADDPALLSNHATASSYALPNPAADAAARGLAVPTFGQPTISGVQGNGFEQDLRVDPTNGNRIYTSVPGALSSDDSWIWRSIDGGKTFKWVPGSHPKIGKPVACAGGGDTELAVDSQGRVYFADLTLANYSTARSDDQGATWPCNNTGIPDKVVDRQWYATDGDPLNGGIIYLANNEFGQGQPTGCPGSTITANNQLVMYRSPIPNLPSATAGLEFGPPNRISGPCDEQIMGNIDVSPVATTTGELVAGQPAQLPQAKRHVYAIHPNAFLDKILIARCFPVDFGAPLPNTSDPSGIRCNDLPVASFPNQKTGADFPSLAIDNVGNLYAIWQQAPLLPDNDDPGTALQVGDSALYYSNSTNEGTTWSTPVQIPTPGLLNNVFTWARAGNDGRVGIMWVGTPASGGGGNTACPNGGPDATIGPWGVYYTMTTNGHDPAGVQFTPPVLASEYPIHRRSIQTVMGGQCANASRVLGDFFQMGVGADGEAHLSYANSNQRSNAHAMYVRQNGGDGLYVPVVPAGAGALVAGDPILVNGADDPAGDGKYQLNGVDDPNKPNLDILRSTLTKPAAADCHPAGTACYRAELTLSNLSFTPPQQDATIVWNTQWFVPVAPNAPECAVQTPPAVCTQGGKNFHVYAESVSGAPPRCYAGEGYVQRAGTGGGSTRTYPGFINDAVFEITTAGACTATQGPNGKIAIEVPVSAVTLPNSVSPFVDGSFRRFSVTATTQALPGPATSVPPQTLPQVGLVAGLPPDVLDVVRAYNSTDDVPTGVVVSSFRAVRARGGVSVAWRTHSEVALAGFNVYRDGAKVNRALIRAKGGIRGATYRFVDRGARRGGTYRLQGVALDGTKTWRGRSRAR